MTSEDYAVTFVGLFLWQVPLFLVSVRGLWLIISRKRLRGRVARWSIWGFSLVAAYSLAGAFVRTLLLGIRSEQIVQRGSEAAVSLMTVNLLGAAIYPLFVVGFIMLASAVFVDRGLGRNEDVSSGASAGSA